MQADEVVRELGKTLIEFERVEADDQSARVWVRGSGVRRNRLREFTGASLKLFDALLEVGGRVGPPPCLEASASVLAEIAGQLGASFQSSDCRLRGRYRDNAFEVFHRFHEQAWMETCVSFVGLPKIGSDDTMELEGRPLLGAPELRSCGDPIASLSELVGLRSFFSTETEVGAVLQARGAPEQIALALALLSRVAQDRFLAQGPYR